MEVEECNKIGGVKKHLISSHKILLEKLIQIVFVRSSATWAINGLEDH